MASKRQASKVADDAGEKVEELLRAAQSEATTRSYAQALRHFKANGGSVPCTGAALAGYLASFAGKLKLATLQHRLVAIHRAHTDVGLPSPAIDVRVKRTMQGIRRTYGVAQRRVKAIVKDDLLEMLVMVDRQQPMKAARDRALLLLGFAGAFRRSELVAIQVEDVTVYRGGIEVLLRRSKTDQEGRGRTVFIPYAKGDRCPVKAVQAWLALSGVRSGHVFAAVNRHDRVVTGRPLSAQSVALIVKQAVVKVKGVEAGASVSGHSLRAGFVTEAAIVGLQPFQVREVTGHKSDATLARYIRPVNNRKIPSLL